MTGRQIHTLLDLVIARTERKSVIGNRFFLNKPIPAAVMLNMSGEIIFRAISDGLWEYKKEQRK